MNNEFPQDKYIEAITVYYTFKTRYYKKHIIQFNFKDYV